MDRKLPDTTEARRLIEQSAAARACLGCEIRALKHRLDVPARVRDSLKKNPRNWLFGSLGTGLAISLLFRGKKTSVKPSKKARSLPIAMLGLTLTAVRPLAKVWLTDLLKKYLTGELALPGALRKKGPYSSNTHIS